MKERDRIEEILSDKSSMDTETLEKISSSCNVLSEEQKNRIFGIIMEKESGEKADKENTDENEIRANIIEYRGKNNMKIIAAIAACACIVTGLTALLARNNENINVGNDRAEVTTVSVSVTEPAVSDSENQETKPYVTAVSEKSEKNTETVTSVVKVTGEEGTVVTENKAAATEKKTEEIKPQVTEESSKYNDIFEFAMNKEDQNCKNENVVGTALANSGFSDEQIRKILNTRLFSRFAEDVITDTSEDKHLGNSEFLTGYSYESFQKLINYYFADDAEYVYVKENYDENGSSCELVSGMPSEQWHAGNVNGELKILGSSYSCYSPDECSVEITEKSDSVIKFVLHCGRTYNGRGLFSEYEDKYDNPDDVIAAFVNDYKDGIYFGPNFAGAEYSEENGYLVMFDYTEEMVKTADGWKFSRYEDYRR